MKKILYFALVLAMAIGCKATKESTLSSEAFDQKLQQKNAVLVDVRTPAEYDSAHLPGAVMINYRAADFKEKVSQLDKSQTYLLYCRSGSRSAGALKVMKDAGFKKVYDLYGGIYGYKGKVEVKE